MEEDPTKEEQKKGPPVSPPRILVTESEEQKSNEEPQSFSSDQHAGRTRRATSFGGDDYSFLILRVLNDSTRKDVINHCIRMLEDCPDESLDYFLPQVCTLLVCINIKTNSPTYLHLIRLVLQRCVRSIHLALKTCWMLQACAATSTRKRQKRRAESLWRTVEIAMVNSAVPRTITFHLNSSKQKQKRVLTYSLEPMRPPTETLAAPVSSNELAETTDTEPTTTEAATELESTSGFNIIGADTGTAFSGSSYRHVEIDFECKEEKIEQAAVKNDLPNAQLPILVPLSKTVNESQDLSPGVALREEIRSLAVRKQERSAYFNSHMELFRYLEELSETLLRYTREDRQDLLKHNLKQLNLHIPKNLYFPVMSASDQHFRVLRIIPDECRAINTATKAPCLITAEVQYTGTKASAPGIGSSYHMWSLARSGKERSAEPNTVQPGLLSPGALAFDTQIGQVAPLMRVRSQYEIEKDKRKAAQKKEHLTEQLKNINKKGSWKKSEERRRSNATGNTSEDVSVESTTPTPRRNSVNLKFDPFRKTWKHKKSELLQISPNRDLPDRDIKRLLFKAGDDLRQELLAMQLIKLFNVAWKNGTLPLAMRQYSIVVTSPQSGIIEFLSDSISVDELKQKNDNISLKKFIDTKWGPAGSSRHDQAMEKYVTSLAAYSLFQYICQVKDRHNGNIMIDNEASLIHIDYGFMLSNSPANNMRFENAPFKLTADLLEPLGQPGSKFCVRFETLMIRGFWQLRKFSHHIESLVAIMVRGSPMSCFAIGKEETLTQLRARFHLNLTYIECQRFIHQMIVTAKSSWRSAQYDYVQYMLNNIHY